MKTYGARRFETLACKYGCCGTTPLAVRRRRGGKPERAFRKAARHRARQEARRIIRSEG